MTSMTSFMSTEEVLKDLKISESTLKNWEKQFQIKKSRGPGNKKRYDQEAMDVLRLVKGMRDQDRGFETIQRIIRERNVEAAPASQVPAGQPTDKEGVSQAVVPVENNAPAPVVSEPPTSWLNDKQDIITEIVNAIHEQTELSEKFARATYSIGQLEAEKRALQAQVEELKGTIDSQRSILDRLKQHWFIRLFWVDG
jgi:DNA-binding transcriptional MerR regulator